MVIKESMSQRELEARSMEEELAKIKQNLESNED